MVPIPEDPPGFNAYLTDLMNGQAAAGAPVVAYFDLDRTLIDGYTITSLALEKMWSGTLSPKRIIRHAGIFLHWGLGWSDYHQLLESTVGALEGYSESEMVEEPATTILSPQLFRIVSEESEARFSVYETFPEGTAIGRTDQIAGDIIVDFNNPSNSQLGTIRINLRTLQTDDPDRDRSIRCCVLLTARPEYEFADFVPTSIGELPSQVELGQPSSFQVTGDLTLRGVTRSVTFDVNLTVIDADVLQGFATTAVNRMDFSILNDADNGFDYHGVEEMVTLEFDFVARSVPE